MMLLRHHKPLLMVLAACAWLAYKIVIVSAPSSMDTHCQSYSQMGTTVYDCVACVKFDQESLWSVKDMQITLAGSNRNHSNIEQLSGVLIQQKECIQYECRQLLMESDPWMEGQQAKSLLTEKDMQLVGATINLPHFVGNIADYKRQPNVSSLAVRYRIRSDRQEMRVELYHPKESIANKAMVALIGLLINGLELPYLLVFIPRIDVLVQSAMVYDTISGLALPCSRMLSSAFAIAYGCLSIFHTKFPDVWLRLNILLILLIGLLSGNKYVATSIGMLVVSVEIYRSYLDPEAIWATIIIAFYLVRLIKDQNKGVSPRLTYDMVPDTVVEQLQPL